ncbi:hypothetical protein NDU88_005758 [Pleurodeles waltl]|uniref:Uncharacterized protein n=1 Tax=Pleurodeles waltl TaxID=8319 RepID=A0AAV7LNN8_PLEWA|nr:hypothetical protein NDU88_005758 [Pleurodeles waltl]
MADWQPVLEAGGRHLPWRAARAGCGRVCPGAAQGTPVGSTRSRGGSSTLRTVTGGSATSVLGHVGAAGIGCLRGQISSDGRAAGSAAVYAADVTVGCQPRPIVRSGPHPPEVESGCTKLS